MGSLNLDKQPVKVLLTAEEFDNYPFEEDKRYELDEGELIEMTRPAFRHNDILYTIQMEVGLYLRANPIGIALLSENLYALSPLTRRSPDLAVILNHTRAELVNAKVIPIVPDIAVEVLSPSETPRMISRKLQQYFNAGVREAWIIEPESRTVVIYIKPDVKLTLEGSDVLTSALLPKFSLSLDTLFAL
jgi:Uma2 family endonuclease